MSLQYTVHRIEWHSTEFSVRGEKGKVKHTCKRTHMCTVHTDCLHSRVIKNAYAQMGIAIVKSQTGKCRHKGTHTHIHTLTHKPTIQSDSNDLAFSLGRPHSYRHPQYCGILTNSLPESVSIGSGRRANTNWPEALLSSGDANCSESCKAAELQGQASLSVQCIIRLPLSTQPSTLSDIVPPKKTDTQQGCSLKVCYN